MWPIERKVVPPIFLTRSAHRIGRSQYLLALLISSR